MPTRKKQLPEDIRRWLMNPRNPLTLEQIERSKRGFRKWLSERYKKYGGPLTPEQMAHSKRRFRKWLRGRHKGESPTHLKRAARARRREARMQVYRDALKYAHSDRQRQIMQRLVGGESQSDVARALGRSRERIRQIAAECAERMNQARRGR